MAAPLRKPEILTIWETGFFFKKTTKTLKSQESGHGYRPERGDSTNRHESVLGIFSFVFNLFFMSFHWLHLFLILEPRMNPHFKRDFYTEYLEKDP